ncbi:integrin alpha-4 isoform X1 [Varanus komodoensis]|uniref:integrin alpha-4 isoform X1 n=1 Tax=Varanus komodoensis TaxID=61221 RepID=UPI001CF7C16F|nr:integrin alpha-4 isoform X1 [Varanus komodoensis]XP_044282955.1 integrin alpha-4 isoform X1 [Varanus komodoensis]
MEEVTVFYLSRWHLSLRPKTPRYSSRKVMRAPWNKPKGGTSAAAPARLLLLLSCCTAAAQAYNLDAQRPLVFQGLNGTLFGYSVLLHSSGPSRWLVVGAPKANWTANNSVVNPGTIFRCQIGKNPARDCEPLQLGDPKKITCGKTCLEERDNQWLGVSISRQPGENGSLVACGHRWKNVFYISENKFPNGICYDIPSDFRTLLSRQISPCYKDYWRKYGEKYGSCQAGIATAYTKDLIIMGAPGSDYWTGSIFVYDKTKNIYISYVDSDNRVKSGSYLGYAVGAGHFLSPNSIEVIGGAPQQEQTGKAYILRIESRKLSILTEVKGKKLGSYFGATVCAADLNGDGFSDLLVGAPMDSKVREEGRVYVYINSGSEAKMIELETALAGSDLYAARFGESIANLGDIDNDGFEDVAIGAPHENDLEGAIYIYNGRKDGISATFSQRIQGHQLSSTLRMFGQSIAGRIDVDNNGYADVAVGAFLSDSAVLLRTRAVVIADASLKHPSSVNRTILDCVANGQPAVCMNLMLCLNYSGHTVPGYLVFLYDLSLDVSRRADTAARFYFASNGSSATTSGSIRIYNSNNATCATHQAFLRKDVRDILTPVHVEATYRLGHHILETKNTDELPPLQPVLQQRKESEIIRSKFMFARFCSQENCSANLLLSGKLAFPAPHEKKTYLAVGNMKMLMLNVTLYNAGDDAYQTALHIQLPKGLYFTKILEQEEAQIHCEVLEKGNQGVKLDCSVGHLYVDHLSKMDFSFVLDASSLSRAGDDLSISVNTTCENELDNDLLLDNSLILTLPQKHEVELNAHGSVMPTSFFYGPGEESSPVTCMKETINFTFHVSNPGLSLAPAVDLRIQIPNSLAPSETRLFNILEVKSTAGQCQYRNDARDCTLPEKNETIFQDFITYFTKLEKRSLYCMKDDPFCLQILCNLGDMESGKEATVDVTLEATSALVAVEDTSSLQFEVKGKVSAHQDPKVIEVFKDKQVTHVILEGFHNRKTKTPVTVLFIGISSIIGIILLLLLAYFLWKIGFFQRKYKALAQKQDESQSFIKSEQNDKCEE